MALREVGRGREGVREGGRDTWRFMGLPPFGSCPHDERI